MHQPVSLRLLAIVLAWSLLFSLASVVGLRANDKPERLWQGMRLRNDQYDWLRPPDSALEVAVKRGYSGKANAKDIEYSYKREIAFPSFRWPCNVTLHTPAMLAESEGQSARDEFKDQPTVEAVSVWRNWFLVGILVHSSRRADAPNLALLHAGRRIRPDQELSRESWRHPCSGSPKLRCWSTSVIVRFRFSGDEPVRGVGEIVFRWDGAEARVPVNFDYLW